MKLPCAGSPSVSEGDFFRVRRKIRFPAWLLVVGIGLIVCVPIFLYGVPYSGDVPHHYRLAQCFYDSITSGDPYPSWLSFTNGGYGDPSVRFYPPALSYLLACFRLLTGDWYWASLVALALLTVTGGLGVYLWASALTERRYAVLAGLLYMLAPFHASEMFQAGMYAQYACASVLPFVLAFTERIIRRNRWRDVAGLGVSFALLALFNLPMLVLGSLAAGVYALTRLAQSFRLRSIFQLALGVLGGLALSCFYWLPMLFEMHWKSPSGVGQGAWFDYRNNFIFRPSPNATGDWWVTILVIVTLFMAAPALLLFRKRKREALAPALVALFSFLMATPLSKPIWDALPPLQETQFPWRWLTITALCLSLLVAWSLPELERLWRTRLRPWTFALAGVTIIALSFTALQVIRGAVFLNQESFDRMVALLRDSETHRDFFPVWAASLPRKMEQPVEAEGRDVHLLEWSESRKEFKLSPGDTADIRLRTFYYPYWKATAGGQPLDTRPAEDGALLVYVPPSINTVRVEFVEPGSTYLAGVISLLGLLAIAFLLSRPEPSDVLVRVQEARDHAAIVSTVTVHNLNPG